jgi:AraC-like DNA-binding protein
MVLSRKSPTCHIVAAPGGVELMRARYTGQRFSKHFHEGYALGVIEDGALAFRYRGENLVAAPGEINLTVPGEVHDGHAATGSGWAYRMFYLPEAALAEAAAEFGPNRAAPYFPRAVLRDPDLAGGVASVHRTLCDPATPTLAKESLLLTLLVTWIARHAANRPTAPKTPAERPAMRKAADFLRERSTEDVRLSDLARLTGLTPFHLIRVFARHTGLTPHAYLTGCRLERAKALLNSPLRLADLAAETGFADQSHLTRLFKRRYGVTPAAYRNFVQNGTPPEE